MKKSVALSLNNISKRYQIGVTHEKNSGLRHVMEDWIQSLVKNVVRGKRIDKSSEDSTNSKAFWALDDISFDVQQGEVLGIIGRNGSGKSTLLKILSRITEPTKGRINIKGRMSSLLEVGTGFHPELTGRENIYLNGTILGMSRSEVKSKFDEIVAFSEIEKFIDTPVKRYSSGMYVRLAFAVAAHLEPEILLVDEVLAVGDVQFQKKCLGKMKEVSSEGRTILFVSHSMPTISSLCSRCILLENGKMIANGSTSDVVVRYYSSGSYSQSSCDFTSSAFRKQPGTDPIGDDFAELLWGSVETENGITSSEINISEPFLVKMKYRILNNEAIAAAPNFHFFSADGGCAFVSFQPDVKVLSPGDYEVICRIPEHFMNEGTYFIGLSLSSFEKGIRVHIWQPNALTFNVRDPIEGNPTRGGYPGLMPGIVRPLLNWDLKRLS